MVGRLLIEGAVLSLPAIVFMFHRNFPANRVTPYLIPRLLADKKYPKAELRQAAMGCYLLASWCFSVVYVTFFFFQKTVEQSKLLLPLLFFVLPIVTLMSLVIGTIYLVRGIFGRGDAVKSSLESFQNAEKDQLPAYIRKIKIFNAVNLLCPCLLILCILSEEAMGVANHGGAILLNVSLLVTFIMTLWRIRFYLVKAALVMDLSANKILSSTLSSPLGIFFVWIHSFLLIRKFRQRSPQR